MCKPPVSSSAIKWVALLWGVGGCAGAWAQTVVPAGADSGVQLQQIEKEIPRQQAVDPQVTSPPQPSARAADGPRVEVKGFSFVGNSRIDSETLQRLVAEDTGERTFGELMLVAERITRLYRDAGYTVARAYLPAQELDGGIVTVAVLEGRVGAVETDGAARVPDALLKGYVANLRRGEVMTNQALERTLLLLNDLPGVAAQATLKAGDEPGVSDVAVRLAATPAVSGYLLANNYGQASTGEYRLGGGLHWNNPLGLGDRLSLSLLGADGGADNSGDTAYGSLAYTLPVGGDGTRLGLRYSNVAADVGAALKDFGIENSASSGSLFATHPLIRSRRHNLLGQAALSRRESRQTFDPAFRSLDTDETLNVATLGLSGDSRGAFGGGGFTTFSLTLDQGLDDYAASDRPARLSAEADFTRLSFDLARLQQLTPRLALHARLRGQYSGDILPSSEQLVLGGPGGVRAFSASEGLGDKGYLASGELRYRMPSWGALVSDTFLYGFYDTGHVRLNSAGPGVPTAWDLRAAGIGLRFNLDSDIAVDMAYARQAGGDDPRGDNEQAWFQLVKWFN